MTMTAPNGVYRRISSVFCGAFRLPSLFFFVGCLFTKLHGSKLKFFFYKGIPIALSGPIRLLQVSSILFGDTMVPNKE